MEFQLRRAFEPVIRSLVGQHYSVESGDVKLLLRGIRRQQAAGNAVFPRQRGQQL